MRHNSIRLWAVLVWLLLWQLGSMALGYALLLPSPLASLKCLLEMAGTAAFWRAIGWSAVRIFGGFFAACWQRRFWPCRLTGSAPYGSFWPPPLPPSRLCR